MFSKNRILLASTIIASSFAAAPAAFAQTLTATLAGNIPGRCTENINNPGTLAPDNAVFPPEMIGTDRFVNGGGAAAVIEVTCNEFANITLDSLTQTDAPDADPAGTEYNISVVNTLNGSEAFNAVASPGIALGSPLPLSNGTDYQKLKRLT